MSNKKNVCVFFSNCHNLNGKLFKIAAEFPNLVEIDDRFYKNINVTVINHGLSRVMRNLKENFFFAQ